MLVFKLVFNVFVFCFIELIVLVGYLLLQFTGFYVKKGAK